MLADLLESDKWVSLHAVMVLRFRIVSGAAMI